MNNKFTLNANGIKKDAEMIVKFIVLMKMKVISKFLFQN